MDTEKLQKEWQDQSFDKDLILKLFRESKQEKVDYNLRKLRFFSILFMLYNLGVIIWSWLVLVENFDNYVVRFSAIIMLILSYVVFYKNVRQIGGISRLDITGSVVSFHKQVEQLKIQRIRHNRFIFIFCILYFWLIVALFPGWDLAAIISTVWANARIVVVIHGAFLLIWFPLSIWILRKYDSDKSSGFWKKLKRESFLTDESVNMSLNQALNHLDEIETFEKGKQ